MIELFGTNSPNVHKVEIMLGEVGLPFHCTFVNIFQAGQYDPEFLKLNPTNKVPVIVDSDGPGGEPITVFESGAILIYLAEKTGKLLSRDPRQRAHELEWLMVQMGTLGPMSGQAVHFTRFAPDIDYARERYYSQCAHLHRVLDARLAVSEYLGGPDFSIADVATWPWIDHAMRFFDWLGDGGMAKSHPHLDRWRVAVGSRPGLQAGLAAAAELMAVAEAARLNRSADALERFVLRGAYSATPA